MGILADLTPRHGLRSAEMDLLTVPRSLTKAAAARRFSSAAPTVWNGLPLAIRNSGSIGTFKAHIKAHRFRRHFLAEKLEVLIIIITVFFSPASTKPAGLKIVKLDVLLPNKIGHCGGKNYVSVKVLLNATALPGWSDTENLW